MERNKIKVAVIDDGIVPKSLDINLCFNIRVNSKLQIISAERNEGISSHGTICASIIRKYTKNADIGSIQILGENCKGNVHKLCAALEWCVNNNVKIANISLGSYSFYDYNVLKKCINSVASKGLIMICASQNGIYVTYPASFSNTIGVKCDRNDILKDNQYIYNLIGTDGVEFISFSKHIIKNNLGMELVLQNANSFAAPMITAKVCDIVYKYPHSSLEYIKTKLIQGAINYNCKNNGFILYGNPDWINSAIIFSFNNEYLDIDKYYFSVESVYYINEKNALDIIESTLLSSLKSDSIIIVSQGNNKQYLWNKVINIANSYGKNLIILEDNPQNIFDLELNKLIKIWYSGVKEIEIDSSKQCMNIDVPLIILYYYENFRINDFLYYFKKSFYLKSYNAFISSDKAIGVLYELDFIEDKCFNYKLPNYLGNIIQERNIDICVLGISEKEHRNVSTIKSILNADFIINFQKDISVANIEILETNETIKLQIGNSNLEHAKIICEYIVSYYINNSE